MTQWDMPPLDASALLADFSGSLFACRGAITIVDSGHGYADRKTKEPNTRDTAFQIASISKTFTAAAILLLQQDGALSVRDRVDSYVAGCPDQWKPITLHHLLTHSSGIGHWNHFPDIDVFDSTAREKLIRIVQNRPLEFAPGEGWLYSSLAFVLLAYIVEQVSNQSYAQFLRDRIFRPLGMESTGAGNAPPLKALRAVGYEGDERARSFELNHTGIGAGDVWSTTGDLARWNRALASPGLFHDDSLRAMFAPHVPVSRVDEGIAYTHYGYGWFTGRLHDRRILFHTGDNAGFRSFNGRLPDDDAMVIVLANDHRANVNHITAAIARAVLSDSGRSR
jgi:CubicO group peptidase (beta-lactamase class C family)